MLQEKENFEALALNERLGVFNGFSNTHYISDEYLLEPRVYNVWSTIDAQTKNL